MSKAIHHYLSNRVSSGCGEERTRMSGNTLSPVQSEKFMINVGQKFIKIPDRKSSGTSLPLTRKISLSI
jgi:hypothetical protein